MDNRGIPLEDSWVDVLRKARRGQELTEEALAQRAGITTAEMVRLLGGEFDAVRLEKTARALGLHPASLLALARDAYHPGEVNLPEGIEMFTSDWDSMKVHSYLAWDEASREAVAFDTGADATDLLTFLKKHQLTLRLLLLTHGHGDHVFEADRILEKTGAEAWIGEGEGMEGVPGIKTFAAGKEFRIGSLTIVTRLTKGHAPAGISYVIRGLECPVAIVGDALFAGSMGGPMVSYADCLRTNREEILSLPSETILCPGHGPLTTVALERENNPFFPQSKSSQG
jgi:hydroxyacylglutathione hydrolase